MSIESPAQWYNKPEAEKAEVTTGQLESLQSITEELYARILGPFPEPQKTKVFNSFTDMLERMASDFEASRPEPQEEADAYIEARAAELIRKMDANFKG